MSSSTQIVRVKRDVVAACMTCPLCKNLLKEATTISECLHTFCRKCIYEKLNDEEVDCCPICNMDLGCTPVEKLRPDHSLQDIRAKIFPLRRRKVKAPEVMPSISLPARRKERSISSLVVSTPRVLTQTGLTGRRTKAVGRRATTLKGSSFSIEVPIKKEQDTVEEHSERPSSGETKSGQNKRQKSANADPSNHVPNKDSNNGAEPWPEKSDLWKPLSCLVEAANRTNGSKFPTQGSSIAKEVKLDDPDSEVHAHKTKIREHVNKLKIEDDQDGAVPTTSGLIKSRWMNGTSRKRAASSGDLSSQAWLDAGRVKRIRKANPIWFSLVASSDQEGDARLPQISSCYLRIKDGNVPVSFIQKYLAKKLDLSSEAEVEIICQGQPVVPTLALHNVLEMWLGAASTPRRMRGTGTIGFSAKDFVMVLFYARKLSPP